MNTLSVIGLSICLVYISIIMQGAEADTCSECKKTYEDKGKTCSAANVYVACAKKDCTSLTQISKVFSARAAQKACGAEAGTCISCIADFVKAAGFDKDKVCSAAKTYVECTEEGCKSGVAVAEKAKEAACGTCDACTTTFAGKVGLDREKYCSSAANAYLERAKQDGTMDDIATVALAKAAQQVCGAGSIFVNLAVIGLGLTLYMLV